MGRCLVLLAILLATGVHASVANAGEITWIHNYNGVHCFPACVDDGSAHNQRECQPECGYDLWTMNPDGTGARIERSSSRGQIQDPVWSPDGRRIAYTKHMLAPTPGGFAGVSELHVMEASNPADDRVIAEGPLGVRAYPAWSPDGRSLVFQLMEFVGGGSPMEAQVDLWSVNADGSALRPVTRDRLNEFQPAFSPGGDRITFARAAPGEFPTLFSTARDGTGIRRLAVGDLSVTSGVQFSPDGNNLAFSGPDGGLLVTPTGGGEIRRLTSQYASSPRWSPRGDALLFASADPNGYVGPPHLDLWRVDLGDSAPEPVRLTRFQGTPSYGGGHAWLGSPVLPAASAESAAPAVTLARVAKGSQRTAPKLALGPTTAKRASGVLTVKSSSELRFLAADRTGIRSLRVAVRRRRVVAASKRAGSRAPRFRRIAGPGSWRKMVRSWKPGLYEIRFKTLDVRGHRSLGRRPLLVRVRGR